jgi:hypothetical protein
MVLLVIQRWVTNREFTSLFSRTLYIFSDFLQYHVLLHNNLRTSTEVYCSTVGLCPSSLELMQILVTCTHTHMHAHTSIYIHMHTCTHVHTHRHTYMLINQISRWGHLALVHLVDLELS